MIHIKTITADQTYDIRLEVLRKGISLSFKFKEDFDKDTFHLGAFKGGEMVGVASFICNDLHLFEGKQYQLRGMAVLHEFQGIGIGNRLLEAACSILQEKEIDVLWCNAREKAFGYYKKNGFKLKGELFEIAQIGVHSIMCKKISS